MNLQQLKAIVDFTVENLPKYINPEDILVCITLSESSIGSRAFSGITYANMGIDWESSQFRLEPEKRLVRKGNSMQDAKEKRYEIYDGRKYYFCPICEDKISKDDNFCRSCGQRLK